MATSARQTIAGSLIPEGRRKSDLQARVARLRDRAEAEFEQRGWPSPKDEFWKGFSLDALSAIRFLRAPAIASAPVAIPGWIGRLPGHLVVLIDGRHASGAEGIEATDGARCATLARVIGQSTDPALRALGAISSSSPSVLTSLNMARWEDGVWIRISENARAPLIVIAHVVSTHEVPTACHPRVLITAGEGSRAVIAEVHVGPPSKTYFVNAVTEIDLQARAQVEHVRVLAPGDDAWHVGSTHVLQQESSRYASRLVSIGGGAVRDEVHARLSGEGADTELDGLFLAFGTRHLDHRTLVDHACVRGRSRQLYKGIAAGRGKGGFRGRVLVRQGAQGTDAMQLSRNLVLSRDALLDSAPELEIRADDVRCKHGSSTGALEDDARFYLRCRGIGERDATTLLTSAFAREIVDRLSVPALREQIAGLVDHEVSAASGAEEEWA